MNDRPINLSLWIVADVASTLITQAGEAGCRVHTRLRDYYHGGRTGWEYIRSHPAAPGNRLIGPPLRVVAGTYMAFAIECTIFFRYLVR